MKFARLFTILLSVLTVLSIYQDNAQARATDRMAQSSQIGLDNATLPLPLTDAFEPAPEPTPTPTPKPAPAPDPDPFPNPRPDPPYSS